MVSFSKVSLFNLRLIRQFLLTEAFCLLYIMLKAVLLSFKCLRFSLTTFIVCLHFHYWWPSKAEDHKHSCVLSKSLSYLLKDACKSWHIYIQVCHT